MHKEPVSPSARGHFTPENTPPAQQMFRDVLFQHHAGRFRFATRAAAASLILAGSLAAHPSAHASPAQPQQPQPKVKSTDPDAPPDPASSMRAFKMLNGWVRRWSIPENPAPDDLTAFPGAAITLRLRGEIVGRGSDMGGDLKTLWRAAVAALGEANHRMPLENDALRDESVKEMVRDMTLSLELAGPLVPINVKTFEEAERTLSPGLDGVAVRIGDRTASMFPGTMLATNTTIALALGAMASQAGADPTLSLIEPADLVSKHGATLYRFRVSHLAQPASGREAEFLYRGARLFNLSSLNKSEIQAMADRIAEHLLTRAWPGADAIGMVGTYEPWRDRYEPPVAAPADQLMTAYALLQYAQSPGVNPPRAREAERFVQRVLTDLKSVEPGEIKPWEDPAAAACWVALTALGSAPAPESCRKRVLASFDSENGFKADVPVAARGMVALALVEMTREDSGAAPRQEAVGLAESAVRRAFRDTPEGELVSQMPWLGWAELRLAAIKGRPDVPAAVALRQMRKAVWEHQVGPLDEGASESKGGGLDMVGGIVFAPRTAGTPARPTWQSARPLAFLATMIADARLTPPAEKNLELARLLSGLRFLRQLGADDSTAWMYPNRTRALGGIRAAPWDQRMALDASAITLLTVCEVLKYLDQGSTPP